MRGTRVARAKCQPLCVASSNVSPRALMHGAAKKQPSKWIRDSARHAQGKAPHEAR